jgi:hypothetical protein
MKWKLGCIVFLGQSNQNVIWQFDLWYVWGEFEDANYCPTCAHVDGASIQVDST